LQSGCAAESDFESPPIWTIPHGIDTATFHPLDDDPAVGDGPIRRLRARQTLFADRPGMQDAFLVLNANRHTSRKRLDLTILGFARFAKDKSRDVKLYLHSPFLSPDSCVRRVYCNLMEGKRIFHTPMHESTHPSVTDDCLNLIYNACDIGLNTSSGEGWGLISFEHAATCAAQIVPAHSSCKELWHGVAVLLEPTTVESCLPDYFEHCLVSEQGVSEALELLYADDRLRAHRARAAYNHAIQPAYQWDRIARRWADLFLGVIGNDRSLLDEEALSE
jgi:D-inositol-3-phosphate glycosyltransferase